MSKEQYRAEDSSRNRSVSPSGNKTVEVIVPVYKPGAELKCLLEKLGSQTYRPEAVRLLVTAAGTDYVRICEECCAVLEDTKKANGGPMRFSFVRIEPEQFDHGGTRHLGASRSQAEILLFMTQDAIPENEYLIEKIVEAFGEKDSDRSNQAKGDEVRIGAVYARQLPAPDCNAIEQYTRRFNYPSESRVKTAADLPHLGIKTYFCSNVCAAYRRDIYEKLGGFERRTIFNEDMIFAAGLIKAGYGIAYAADAKVIHSHNYSGMQQLHRNFDLAVSQADHPEIFEGVPSEGEGIRMVKATAAHLCKTGKAYLLPKLVWQSGCKYLGYLLGKRYRRLPKQLVMAITMNKRYWNHETEL